jgi:hypothetical protein
MMGLNSEEEVLLSKALVLKNLPKQRMMRKS